jgi:hypothetical protein
MNPASMLIETDLFEHRASIRSAPAPRWAGASYDAAHPGTRGRGHCLARARSRPPGAARAHAGGALP